MLMLKNVASFRASSRLISRLPDKTTLRSACFATPARLSSFWETLRSRTSSSSTSRGLAVMGSSEASKLERVYFSKRGEYTRLKLEQVPARVFSEVMRDLDLVVSVAHVGGVDPEASMSTLEMRTAMVRVTCRLLKLEKVRIEKNLVLIEGKLNCYSVHLGSGTVHQQPGGYVCIVAVQSQQRGRVFLPFADNDPRTAEVIAKVMLLAKDNEIQDPILLRQIA
jgi:hypothetical protein